MLYIYEGEYYENRFYVKRLIEKIDNDDINITETLEIDNGFILSKNDKKKYGRNKLL